MSGWIDRDVYKRQDHRLTGETKNFNIDAVINGALDPLIDALVLEDQAEKLRAGAEE